MTNKGTNWDILSIINTAKSIIFHTVITSVSRNCVIVITIFNRIVLAILARNLTVWRLSKANIRNFNFTRYLGTSVQWVFVKIVTSFSLGKLNQSVSAASRSSVFIHKRTYTSQAWISTWISVNAVPIVAIFSRMKNTILTSMANWIWFLKGMFVFRAIMFYLALHIWENWRLLRYQKVIKSIYFSDDPVRVLT